MAGQGLCCGSLEQPKALMKMGLSVILIGHVNFMLAALVQGVVLRHIDFQKHHRALEYAISAVVVLTAGLVGIIVGILTIVLAKNKKSRCLTWSVFALCLTSAVLAGVSAVGLLVAVVMVIKNGGRLLLSHCRFPDAIGYSSVTNECPFDPTRIYSTTLILWLPLIVTSVIQLVFSSRCLAVCISFLGLPCCCSQKKRPRSFARSINVVTPLAAEPLSPTRTTILPPTNHPPPHHQLPPLPPPRQTSRASSHHSAHSAPPLVKYTQSPTRPSHARSHSSQPARTHPRAAPRPHREGSKQQTSQTPPPPPPLHAPRQHRNSAPPSGRHPQVKPRRERSQPEAAERARQRLLEEYQLLNRPDQPLERGTMERSSFWI